MRTPKVTRSLLISRPLLISLALIALGAGAFGALSPSTPAQAGVLSYSWLWPVDAPHSVTREFRAPPSEFGAGHRGLDIAVSSGQPVYSPADGHVLFAGMVAGRGVITIDHGNGVVSTLEPVEPVSSEAAPGAAVTPGTAVRAGQVVGLVRFADVVWDEAHACLCLHLGARYAGQYVSPRVLLERARPSVLKPWGDGPPIDSN